MSFGPVVIFGSGETAPGSRGAYEWVFDQLQPPLRLSLLETPAGFEPNSAQVAGRLAIFLEKQFSQRRPEVRVVPARARGTPFSPDSPEVVAPLAHANFIQMGAGSPTFAVRQLRDSLAWRLVQARHRLGAAVVFASAGAVAAGASVLPVYEIYKVGADLHWQPGLDFFGPFGLNLAIVTHWNNSAGGAELDTSRCYMGQARFERLQALLPPATVVLGVDEVTALLLDLEAGSGRVAGPGGVSVLRGGQALRFEAGADFALGVLGPFQHPGPEPGLPARLLRQVAAAAAVQSTAPLTPDAEVLSLVQQREQLRAAHDWSAADEVRRELQAHGWQVEDTPSGPRVRPAR
ncbi:MAG: cysteinyl-tRNA synthetase [Anaerolineales bacterium]|nr:cysteinyl-tRNA synthetase [Anaerolineales bacterium]